MSARSRALRALARHFALLAEQSRRWEDTPRPIYSGSEAWETARDMAERTAEEETWRSRLFGSLRWDIRRMRARRMARRLAGWFRAGS